MTADSHNVPQVTDTCTQVLYHAALILRTDMKDTFGTETQPLNVSDLSLEKTKEVLPTRLQQFLRWLLQSQKSFEEEQVAIEDQSEAEDCDLRLN